MIAGTVRESVPVKRENLVESPAPDFIAHQAPKKNLQNTRINFLGKLFDVDPKCEAELAQEDSEFVKTVSRLAKMPVLEDYLPDFGNMFSIAGNLASMVANFGNFNNQVRSFADGFAKFGTKFFLVANSVTNTLEHIARKNFLSAFGYGADSPIAFFVPQNDTYLARGISSGSYHLSNALSIINKKFQFKNYKEHFAHLKNASLTSVKNFFTSKVFDNFMDSEKAMIGVLGSSLSIIGGLTKIVLNKRRLGKIARDLGGIFKSLNYIHPGNLAEGRKYYWASGIFQVMASIGDFLSEKFPQHRSGFVALSLGSDGFAKHLLRLGLNRGEIRTSDLDLKADLESRQHLQILDNDTKFEAQELAEGEILEFPGLPEKEKEQALAA